MSWKRALGLEQDALSAYLAEPTDPETTAQLVQEADADELEEYIDTLSMIPPLNEAYGEIQETAQDVSRDIAAYNREMRDASWEHRGNQLQQAAYGLGDVAANTAYGAGNITRNAASGTVDAAGDVGVSTVDAVYDVLDAHRERSSDQQAS